MPHLADLAAATAAPHHGPSATVITLAVIAAVIAVALWKTDLRIWHLMLFAVVLLALVVFVPKVASTLGGAPNWPHSLSHAASHAASSAGH